MAAEYQDTDWRVVDYQPYRLDEAIIDRSTRRPLHVRGPKPRRLEPGRYLVCLGAAQTFGRFCPRPFPTILQERLGIPVLNVSHGGAGPAFYCGDNERLLAILNEASAVIVQVMSGRSDSSSLFESDGVGYFRRRADGTYVGCDDAFSELIRSQPRAVCARVVEETRQSWCASYQRLLSGIKVPKILLWFATRTPFYRQGWRPMAGLFGALPPPGNPATVAVGTGCCEPYGSSVSTPGLPAQTFRRFT